MSAAVLRVIAALERCGSRPTPMGGGYSFKCPAHEDHKASGSLTEGADGRALIHCHAGCDCDDILARVGLEKSDLFADAPKADRRIAATYDYTDEAGTLMYQAVRYDPKDFRQRRPDGKGDWVWNLKNTRRVLYALPGLIGAVNAGWTIYVVEGEKDADAINGLESGGEFYATCNSGGAGKWRTEYNASLKRARVVIVADKDDAGRKHARDVQAALRDVAASVEIVEALAGKDAADHLAAGHTLGDFTPLVEASAQDTLADPSGPLPSSDPPTETSNSTTPAELAGLTDDQRAALAMVGDSKTRNVHPNHTPPADILIASSLEGVMDTSAGEVNYLVDKLVPAGAFTLQGAGFKTGKTLVWYSAALDIARGASVFGNYRVGESVKVVVFQFEMPSREDDRRFRRLGIGAGMYPAEVVELVKAGNLTVYNRPPINLGVPRDLARFHDAIRRANAEFVLIDSCIAAFAGQDINDNGTVRQLVADAFGPLTSEGRAVLGLHHKRKKVSGARPDEDDRHAIIGAQAWQASADRVYALERLDFAPIAHEDAKKNHAFRLRLSPVGSWTPEDSEDIVIEVRDVTSEDVGEGTSVLVLAERAQLLAGGVSTQQRVALAMARFVRLRGRVSKAEAFAVVGGDEDVKERTLDAALAYAKGKRWIEQRKAENGKKNAQELVPGSDDGYLG